MSLKSISLRDFVIVHELDLNLSDGFTVLTGETGAGKSILIDALQLALGARADVGVVREGALRCEISAEFDSPSGLAPWLEQAGFESADSLLLRRTIDSQGKSQARMNGTSSIPSTGACPMPRPCATRCKPLWMPCRKPTTTRPPCSPAPFIRYKIRRT